MVLEKALKHNPSNIKNPGNIKNADELLCFSDSEDTKCQ